MASDAAVELARECLEKGIPLNCAWCLGYGDSEEEGDRACDECDGTGMAPELIAAIRAALDAARAEERARLIAQSESLRNAVVEVVSAGASLGANPCKETVDEWDRVLKTIRGLI